MPRKKSKYPDAHMIYSDGSWRIYWRWNGTRYAVAAGFTEKEDKAAVDLLRRQVATTLADDLPRFPLSIADAKAVKRYLLDRYLISDQDPEQPVEDGDPEAILIEYKANLKSSVSGMWASNSYSMLRRLLKRYGSLKSVTHKQADDFLSELINKEKLSIATRNRGLAICMRFYGWAIRTRGFSENPFKGIKQLREAPPEYITYCTKGERERVIAAAKKTERADWVAIAIAFYAGCRREEIYRLTWNDIFLDSGKLFIRKSKTDKQRATPIAKVLQGILAPLKKERGQVVPVINVGTRKNTTWENSADRLIEQIREQLCLPENPNATGEPGEVVGKRRFIATEDDLLGLEAGLKEKLQTAKEKGDKEAIAAIKEKIANYKAAGQFAKDGQSWIPAERIGWTAFRHTFGTLLAQQGVGIDKISAWMGNTPDVCRRHYAQFVPRDKHDKDIDKL